MIISIALMIVGIMGYSFEPPQGYVGDYRAMFSILIYYSLLTMYIFSDLLCKYFGCGFESELKLIFTVAILTITTYGLKHLRKVWEFKPKRILDILTYGSVVYLMNIHVKVKSPFLIPLMLVLSLWLVILLAYILLEFGKIREFITFEDFQLIYVVYATTLLIGMSRTATSLPFLILTVLNAYALYIIIFRYVRPLMELGKR